MSNNPLNLPLLSDDQWETTIQARELAEQAITKELRTHCGLTLTNVLETIAQKNLQGHQHVELSPKTLFPNHPYISTDVMMGALAACLEGKARIFSIDYEHGQTRYVITWLQNLKDCDTLLQKEFGADNYNSPLVVQPLKEIPDSTITAWTVWKNANPNPSRSSAA